MGIYIPGVELPKKGKCITVTMYDDGCVCRAAEIICRAVEVPPHGALKDADALAFAMMDAKNADQALAMVDDAPTIIPADPGKEAAP